VPFRKQRFPTSCHGLEPEHRDAVLGAIEDKLGSRRLEVGNDILLRTSLPFRTVVYFVQPTDGGTLKIGWSCGLRKRLSDLQNGVGSPLRVRALLAASRVTESALHDVFREHRSHGEWFHVCHEINRLLEALTPDPLIWPPRLVAAKDSGGIGCSFCRTAGYMSAYQIGFHVYLCAPCSREVSERHARALVSETLLRRELVTETALREGFELPRHRSLGWPW
jgi:Meiotically Up-regulated Gene 113 (MUG113) protein